LKIITVWWETNLDDVLSEGLLHNRKMIEIKIVMTARFIRIV